MKDGFYIVSGSEKKIYLRSEYVRVGSRSRPLYGGNQSEFGELIGKTGCGLIAMADISLYLSGRNRLTKEEYLKYVNGFNSDNIRLRMLGGILGRKFEICSIDGRSGKLLKGYFARTGSKLTAKLMPVPMKRSERNAPLPDRRCFRIISKALAEDKPVILGVGPSKSHKLPLYSRDSADPCRFQRTNSTSNHYVTITGAVVCKNADTDRQMVLYRVSSWGKKYFIDAEELYEHITADRGIYGRIVGRVSNVLTVIREK